LIVLFNPSKRRRQQNILQRAAIAHQLPAGDLWLTDLVALQQGDMHWSQIAKKSVGE